MESSRAVRNWAAILIFIVGVGALVLSILYDVVPDSAIGGVSGFLQFLFEYFPGAIVVAIGFITLGFGTKQLTSVVGTNRLGQAAFLVWAILVLVSVVASIGNLFDDPVTIENARNAQEFSGIAAIVVGVVAAIFVLRERIVAGFARVAMFVAVALFGLTEILILSANASTSFLWDLPRLIGLVILGLSWWHAGARRRAPVTAK